MKTSDFQAVRLCRHGACAVTLDLDGGLTVHTGAGHAKLTRLEAVWLSDKLDELLCLESARAAEVELPDKEVRRGTH